MSKRFGRNQKRKLLKRQESLASDLKRAKNDLEALRQSSESVLRMFTEYSAFAPVKVCQGGPSYFLSAHRMGSMKNSPFDMANEPVTIQMHSLRSSLLPDETSNYFAIHMVVDHGHGFSYRFNGDVFQRALPFTAKEELCRLLARQMMDYVSSRWPDAASKINGF